MQFVAGMKKVNQNKKSYKNMNFKINEKNYPQNTLKEFIINIS